MREITFACQPNVEGYARTSRREEFLNTMESTVPWAELEALIALHYPQGRQGVLAEYLPLAFESFPMLYFFQKFCTVDPWLLRPAGCSCPAAQREQAPPPARRCW